MNTAIKKDTDWTALFIFLASFSIRAIYILQIHKFPFTEYLTNSSTFDMNVFEKQALYIASGNWLGVKGVFYIEPFYPYFLALIYKIIGYSHMGVYIIQALLTSIGAILLYKIASRLLNRPAGIIAAFIFSFYSMSIYYDAFVLRESLNTFLYISIFYLTLKASVSRKGIDWFSAGVALGLSMLVRQNILLPFILAFIPFTIKPLRKAALCAAIFLSAFFIAISPAVIKNYLASDHKTIEISRGKGAFWVGNTYNVSGAELNWTQEYYDMEAKSQGSLKKIMNLFINEIKNRPREYARLYIRKVWMFFNGYEVPSNTNYYLYREEFPSILRLPLFNFRLISGLGILGVLISLFAKQRPNLAYIFIVVLSFSVILFNIQARYRLASVPFFIIFSSYSVYTIFDRFRRRHYQWALLLTALSIFFYIIMEPDLTYHGFRKQGEYVRAIDRINLALCYLDEYHKGKDRNPSLLDRAMRQCNLAIEHEKRNADSYHVRGYVFLLKKNCRDSIANLKMGIIFQNRNPFLYNELGGAYYADNDYKRALIAAARASRLLPGNKIFEKNLSLLKNENHQ